MNNGNIEKYEVKIISLYGEKTLNELIALKYTAMKLSKAEVLELANEYREKSKLIAKNKGICL